MDQRGQSVSDLSLITEKREYRIAYLWRLWLNVIDTIDIKWGLKKERRIFGYSLRAIIF